MRILKRLINIITALVLINTIATAEEKQELATAYVTDGIRQMSFQYPAHCEIEDEGDIGTYVHLNHTDWVSIMMPKQGVSGVEQLHNNILYEDIIALTDNLHVSAIHGYEHPSPFDRFHDIVEVGVNLPDGTGLIANAYCSYGHTEIYDVLLTILSSVTETESLEDWLIQEWIPYVSQQQ